MCNMNESTKRERKCLSLIQHQSTLQYEFIKHAYKPRRYYLYLLSAFVPLRRFDSGEAEIKTEE